MKVLVSVEVRVLVSVDVTVLVSVEVRVLVYVDVAVPGSYVEVEAAPVAVAVPTGAVSIGIAVTIAGYVLVPPDVGAPVAEPVETPVPMLP